MLICVKSMLTRYVNTKFLSHLNNYDLINKFNYTNYYLIPQYVKISLKIFLKGALNFKFSNLYLKNFLLLYLFCFNILHSKLKFKKFRYRKLKSYSVKVFLGYFYTKKNLFSLVFNFFFYLKKFARPFHFSNGNYSFSHESGKRQVLISKIITFIPSLIILDHKEHRNFQTFKKSKIFLIFTLKSVFTNLFFNFFFKQKKFNKNFFKNFLLVWCFI